MYITEEVNRLCILSNICMNVILLTEIVCYLYEGKEEDIMGIQIQVDPSRLDSSAARIEQQALLYQKHYNQLFQQVEVMSSGWSGKDNQAFTQQIKGFEKDFRSMYLLMKEYANFLKVSAKAYRDMQNDRIAQAKRLAN